MANIPQLISRQQMIGLILDAFLARTNGRINDLSTGSVVTQIFEAVGQVNYKAYADIIQMVDALSSDRAVGEALQRLAKDKDVTVAPAQASSGNVDIIDLSFAKIQTTVYSGQPAPVAGSLVLYVTDASKFLASGRVYIGRGTPNAEGPLDYDSITPQGGGTYWAINLNATTPTAKFHNIGETVIMGQGGNRSVQAGTTVRTPQGSTVTSVSFTTRSPATILDGETTVQNVSVLCQQKGPVGNVPKGSIKEVLGLPFPAQAVNNQAFSNGKDADDDDAIKDKIRAKEQSKAKGTPTAIKNAASDVVAPDELKRVSSAETINFADNSAALVFDDGTGYETPFDGIGIEQVVDSAVGGEREVQLRKRPIAQALVESSLEEPFAVSDLDQLSISVSGITTVHQFSSANFKVAQNATAFEIASSINEDANLNFLATTSRGGKRVVVYPRDPKANNIVVNTLSASDANLAIGLPLTEAFTLRLYKNDQQLFQDGLLARVTTRPQPEWSNSILAGDTLTYQIDGTPEITAVFTLQAFQAIEPTATVNSSTDIETWIAVMNSIMPGVNASLDGEKINLDSNRGRSNFASITITGGTLKDKLFAIGENIQGAGRASDYTLNRQTGQLSIAALSVGDSISAGSLFTRGKVLTESIPSGPAIAGRAWFIFDGNVDFVSNTVQASTEIQFVPSGNKVTLQGRNSGTLQAEAFENAQPGDWLLVWADTATDPAHLVNNQGFWRVESAEQGSITYHNPAGSAGSFVTVLADRIVLVRSLAPIQQLTYPITTLVSFADTAEAQLIGANIDIVGSQVRISTKTAKSGGEIAIIAADLGGQALGFESRTVVQNVPSHLGFSLTSLSERWFPSFTHSAVNTVVSNTVLTDGSDDYPDLGGNLDDYLEFLDQADPSALKIIPESNRRRRVFVSNYDESVDEMTVVTPNYMTSGASVINPGDRFFIRQAYQFGSEDLINVIVDNDAELKAFSAPVARKVTVGNNSAPTIQSFSALDAESSLPLNDTASFNGFSFNDFKIWRRAHTTLTDGSYELKASFFDFGPSGNKARVGFLYPSDISQTELTHKNDISDVIDIGIVLPVSTPRTQNWDGTTSFSVSVVSTGGKDTVTYTYRSGTQPDFSAGGAQLAVGDIAIIGQAANFLGGNVGYSARVSSFTSTSFTVERPTGFATADALSFATFVNQNGTITVTTATPHNIQPGDRIGFYDTAALTIGVYPFDVTYLPTVTGANSFTVPTPSGVPGGTISSATHINNLVTVNAAAHGLSVGNVIQISGASVSAYNGTFAVHRVNSANQFQYVNQGASVAIANDGRFDFQSRAAGTPSFSISAISRAAGGLVTVTATGHTYVSGDLVEIANVDVNDWSNATTYGAGDVVQDPFDSLLYKSLSAGNLNNNPHLSPAFWAVTQFGLTGAFVVASAITNQFTFYYEDVTGATVGTTGNSTKVTVTGKIARSIGASGANLAFGEVGTTAQEVVDYVTNSMADILQMKVSGGLPTSPINMSTADADLAGNYLSGNISAIRAVNGSRLVEMTSDTEIEIGSTIVVDVTNALYDDEYVVLKKVQSGGNWILTCQSSVLSSVTGNISGGSGTFYGYRPYQMMADGENYVLSTNLGAGIGSPQFFAKRNWSEAPELGEELRLIAINSDHLSRFWNRLIVTGLSNLANIEHVQYDTELQISTKTFGSDGAVQVASGLANAGIVALSGSAININDKIGQFSIPYALRKGIGDRSWLKLTQTIRQNKTLGFTPLTGIKVYNNGIEIQTAGSLQTKRASAHDNTTVFQVERHGKFMAFVRISGTSPALSTAGVREGDWVRLKNVLPRTYNATLAYPAGSKVKVGGSRYVATAAVGIGVTPPSAPWSEYSEYSALVDYSAGQYALSSGRLWKALASNGPSTSAVTPGSDADVWLLQEFNLANEGIFPVVRVYGQDSFWIENDSAIEEVTQILDANDLSFYSYDSVMPGDTLDIAGSVLGLANVGRYTVLDDAADESTLFPTSTRIYTTLIPQDSGLSFIVLGSSFSLINVEEETPTVLYKRVLAIGPGDDGFANVIVDSPESIDKISNSLGAYLTMQNKIGFDTAINFGIDGYKYNKGLPAQLNKIIYGDPTSPVDFPGVRAAGTDVDIKGAIIKRIRISLSIRIRTGLAPVEVQDRVKASVAGYINTLGVGEAVSLSQVISAAGNVNGVISVAITSPTFDAVNDLIAVGADQKAFVVDTDSDILVSISGV